MRALLCELGHVEFPLESERNVGAAGPADGRQQGHSSAATGTGATIAITFYRRHGHGGFGAAVHAYPRALCVRELLAAMRLWTGATRCVVTPRARTLAWIGLEARRAWPIHRELPQGHF